jgi:hypothetical protein
MQHLLLDSMMSSGFLQSSRCWALAQHRCSQLDVQQAPQRKLLDDGHHPV